MQHLGIDNTNLCRTFTLSDLVYRCYLFIYLFILLLLNVACRMRLLSWVFSFGKQEIKIPKLEVVQKIDKRLKDDL